MYRVVLAFVCLTAPALANSITIGTLTYLGENSQGASQYQIQINTNGITAQPFGNVLSRFGTDLGSLTFAIPTTAAFTETFLGGNGLHNCPCTSISLTMLFDAQGHRITFLLANGQPFTAHGISTATLLPLSGQSFIQPNQSVPIQITAVPEPTTMLLLGSGLVGVLVRRRGNRR